MAGPYHQNGYLVGSGKRFNGGDNSETRRGLAGKVTNFLKENLGFGKPTADVTGLHLPSISLEKADIVVDVLVSNPNPIPIPLIDILYLIESEGRKLVSGTISNAGTIRAYGSETLKIPVTLVYQDIRSTYDDIKPGEVIPYRVRVELLVDVPVLGHVRIPLEKTGEIPIPYKPEVNVDKIELEHVSLEKTAASLHFKVVNKNKFDLGIRAMDYTFKLADTAIASATLRKAANVTRCGEGIVEVPITFHPMDMGSAVWDIIRGQGAGYSMVGKLEVDTPFGPMHLPFSKEGGQTIFTRKEDLIDYMLGFMGIKNANSPNDKGMQDRCWNQ